MTKVHSVQNSELVPKENDTPSPLRNFFQKILVTRYELVCLGITIVIGGQVSGFNAAYEGGYGIALFAVLFTGLGYFCLTCSLAEMSSALPFSGGVYGFVRAFTHPWVGFLIACNELILNLFYVSGSVYTLATIPIDVFNHVNDEAIDDGFTHSNPTGVLVGCLLIYIFVAGICVAGGRFFWTINVLVAVVVLGLMLIYIFGSFPNVDFERWASTKTTVNAYTILAYLGPVSGNYLGIQYLPLMSKDVENPRQNIPRAMIISMLIFIATSVGLITINCSQYPGIDHLGTGVNYPLSYGYQGIFGISYNNSKWLSTPGLFAIAFGFIFCYAKQALCMAQSGYFPKVFQLTSPYVETPYVGIICGSILCFLLNVVNFYEATTLKLFTDVSNIASYIVFIGASVAYIQFLRHYSSLAREFQSPFGILGAIVCIVVFLVCLVGVLAYSSDNGALYFTIGVFVFGSLGFFRLVSGNQVFSAEEKANLFKAYLVSANIAKRARIRKNQVGKQLSNSHQNTESEQSPAVVDIARFQSISRNHNSVVPAENFETGNVAAKPVEIEKTRSISEKIVGYVSSSMKLLLPEIPEEQTELVLLQSGGIPVIPNGNMKKIEEV